MLLSSDGMLTVSPPARETPLLAETSFLGAVKTDDAEDVLTTGGLPNTDPTYTTQHVTIKAQSLVVATLPGVPSALACDSEEVRR